MSTKQPIKEHIAEYNFARARDSFRQEVPPQRSAYAGTRCDEQLLRTKPPVWRDTRDDEDALYTTHAPNSTRRYPPQGPAYVEVHRAQPQAQRAITPPSTKGRVHPLLFVAVGMLLMLALWLAFGMVANWWTITHDDLIYGRPRTYQADANVGHGSLPSHFIVINWHRHIEVVEIPQGNPADAKLYEGPTLTGNGQDLTPVTLEFKDVNGDGKPDMIIEAGDSRFVFINDRGAFRPQKAGEQISL